MRLTTKILIAIAIIVGAVLLYALYDKEGFNSFINPDVKTTEDIGSDPPEEVMDPKTGEVDQQSFEKNQAVSQDDSLDTLETELDSTIILEEDFSDL